VCWRRLINAPKKKCLVGRAMDDNPMNKGRQKNKEYYKEKPLKSIKI